jgi:hypothetical protein
MCILDAKAATTTNAPMLSWVNPFALTSQPNWPTYLATRPSLPLPLPLPLPVWFLSPEPLSSLSSPLGLFMYPDRLQATPRLLYLLIPPTPRLLYRLLVLAPARLPYRRQLFGLILPAAAFPRQLSGSIPHRIPSLPSSLSQSSPRNSTIWLVEPSQPHTRPSLQCQSAAMLLSHSPSARLVDSLLVRYVYHYPHVLLAH